MRENTFCARHTHSVARNCPIAAATRCWRLEGRVNREDDHAKPSDALGGSFSRFLRLIRFSHTIFALPFSLGALFVAANGWPSVRILVLVIVCMVFARTSAMVFNRLVDWSLDQRNPRTASRHLLISKLSALILLILSSAAFLLAASAINRLTFLLAPVA